jgi:hypothetical protein
VATGFAGWLLWGKLKCCYIENHPENFLKVRRKVRRKSKKVRRKLTPSNTFEQIRTLFFTF